mmetsp:Transcript_27379/g.81585  ORF Transcript_27379/g.81585 Transcript_27379/m.81585 type:complete len:83 (+) Transcript_27379:621-869(+)
MVVERSPEEKPRFDQMGHIRGSLGPKFDALKTSEGIDREIGWRRLSLKVKLNGSGFELLRSTPGCSSVDWVGGPSTWSAWVT